jgi:hypothetical protein
VGDRGEPKKILEIFFVLHRFDAIVIQTRPPGAGMLAVATIVVVTQFTPDNHPCGRFTAKAHCCTVNVGEISSKNLELVHGHWAPRASRCPELDDRKRVLFVFGEQVCECKVLVCSGFDANNGYIGKHVGLTGDWCGRRSHMGEKKNTSDDSENFFEFFFFSFGRSSLPTLSC